MAMGDNVPGEERWVDCDAQSPQSLVGLRQSCAQLHRLAQACITQRYPRALPARLFIMVGWFGLCRICRRRDRSPRRRAREKSGGRHCVRLHDNARIGYVPVHAHDYTYDYAHTRPHTSMSSVRARVQKPLPPHDFQVFRMQRGVS